MRTAAWIRWTETEESGSVSPTILQPMNTKWLMLAACLIFSENLIAQSESEVTQLLAQLRSDDVDARRDAMYDLQTSLDPRIPDACLPLLKDDGDSTKRIAARAIGSRWHQIPKERIGEFTTALKPLLKVRDSAIARMAERGITLLTKKYTGDMVSRSHSKRWVVYERRGLPCIIDTTNSTEELIGFGSELKLLAAYGNAEINRDVKWHPLKDAVAFLMLEFRRVTTPWVWDAEHGLHQISVKDAVAALGHPQARLLSSFTTEIVGWVGDLLDVNVTFSLRADGGVEEHEANIRIDPSTGKVTKHWDNSEFSPDFP